MSGREQWAACNVGGEFPGRNAAGPLKRADLRQWEVSGMRGVAVKCIAVARNSDCEGGCPVLI